MPRQSGFDQRDAYITTVHGQARDETSVPVNISDVHIHGSAKDQIAGKSLGARTEILTAFRTVDSFKAYADFLSIAQHADGISVHLGDDSACEFSPRPQGR